MIERRYKQRRNIIWQQIGKNPKNEKNKLKKRLKIKRPRGQHTVLFRFNLIHQLNLVGIQQFRLSHHRSSAALATHAFSLTRSLDSQSLTHSTAEKNFSLLTNTNLWIPRAPRSIALSSSSIQPNFRSFLLLKCSALLSLLAQRSNVVNVWVRMSIVSTIFLSCSVLRTEIVYIYQSLLRA